jgi:hypothetical protein
MPLYGRGVKGTLPPIDRADVQQTDDELTLILSTAGVRVMLLRVQYDSWIDEVINSSGTVSRGPGAWTLIDHDPSLERGPQAATALRFPRDCRLRLDLDDGTIRQVRAALPEILQCACFVVDTPEGRFTS